MQLSDSHDRDPQIRLYGSEQTDRANSYLNVYNRIDRRMFVFNQITLYRYVAYPYLTLLYRILP